MITTHWQNRCHKVGQSGTTMQFMSPTLSDTAIMTKILAEVWISSSHLEQFVGQSYRM
jgi:hypothetical protein